MSVVKLFSRIIAPDKDTVGQVTEEGFHDNTFGITSDPLTQFAVIMSALIHDVDHMGIPNSQMTNEGLEVAKYYKGQSVAEQVSSCMSCFEIAEVSSWSCLLLTVLLPIVTIELCGCCLDIVDERRMPRAAPGHLQDGS